MKRTWTIQKLKKRLVEDRKLDFQNKNATNLSKEALFKNEYTYENPRYELYNDLFTEGMIIPYPHGRILKYGMKPFHYRGQIKDYGSCNSSLGRVIKKEPKESRDIEKFIKNLKVNELSREIDKLKQVKEWQEMGDVLGYAIAQHYGMETDIMDITSNLGVALFFATCIHTKNNRYRPLNKKDLKKNKEGVLYIRHQEFDPIGKITVFPIGFQPFTRCHKQRGYFVVDDLTDEFDIEKIGFQKVYFKHDLKFSKEIFEMFKGGKSIFEYDLSKEIENLVEDIKISKEHSFESFEQVYETYISFKQEDGEVPVEKNEMEKYLNKKEITLLSKKEFLTKEMIEVIDSKWSLDDLIEKEGILPGYREVLYSH